MIFFIKFCCFLAMASALGKYWLCELLREQLCRHLCISIGIEYWICNFVPRLCSVKANISFNLWINAIYVPRCLMWILAAVYYQHNPNGFCYLTFKVFNQGWIKTECTMRIVAEIHVRPLSRNLVFWNPTTPTDGRVSVFCWTVRRIEAHCAAGNNLPRSLLRLLRPMQSSEHPKAD